MKPSQQEILKLRIEQQKFAEELQYKIMLGFEAIPELITQGNKNQALYLAYIVRDFVEMLDSTRADMAYWTSD